MFGWAAETFDKLSQAVAPVPEDAGSKFVYSVQKGDEAAAQGTLAEMDDPLRTMVQPNKGTFPIHLACQYGMMNLVKQLMAIPNADIQVCDRAGNTPLHYACLSTNKVVGASTVRVLVMEYKASVVAKNFQGQTPYDVASLNNIRQYLLPLQLQQETQAAIDNGGVGLPAGIDMGGLRIRNSAVPPPPIGGVPGGPPAPPVAGPPGSSFYNSPSPVARPKTASTITAPLSGGAGTPPVSTASPPPPAPTSSGSRHEYSRCGSSSAAIYSRGGIKPDGFHSSSSDVNLQRKYGHHSAPGSGNFAPPPPSSGNSMGSASSLSALSGPNPYSGATRLGSRNRYPVYGPTSQAAPSSGGFNPGYAGQAAAVSGLTMFTPGIPQRQPLAGAVSAPAAAPHAHPTAQQQPPPAVTNQTTQPVAAASSPSSPYGMPPPPFSGLSSAGAQEQHQPSNNTPSPQHQTSPYAAPPQQQQQTSPYAPPSQQQGSPYSAPQQQQQQSSPYAHPSQHQTSPYAAPPQQQQQQTSPYAPQQQTSPYAAATTVGVSAQNLFSSPTPTNTPAVAAHKQIAVSHLATNAEDIFATPSPMQQQPPLTVTEEEPTTTTITTNEASSLFGSNSATTATNEVSATSVLGSKTAADTFATAPASLTTQQPRAMATVAGDETATTDVTAPQNASNSFAGPPPSEQAATDAFSAPPPAGTQQQQQPPTRNGASSSAEDVYGSSSSNKDVSSSTAFHNEASEELMDVPLSPDKGDGKETLQQPLQPQQEAPNAAAALFGSIGLPPPPFSSS